MSTKTMLSPRFTLAIIVALAGLAPAAHAITADATIQVLDQLDVFSSANLKRSTDSPVSLVDLNSVGSTALKACRTAATDSRASTGNGSATGKYRRRCPPRRQRTRAESCSAVKTTRSVST